MKVFTVDFMKPFFLSPFIIHCVSKLICSLNACQSIKNLYSDILHFPTHLCFKKTNSEYQPLKSVCFNTPLKLHSLLKGSIFDLKMLNVSLKACKLSSQFIFHFH